MEISQRMALLASAAVWIPTASALAQTQPAVPSAPAAAAVQTGQAGTSDALPEIIVTANRRSENLSRTPVSASVVSPATLAKSQIVTETDLRTTVPGLSVRQSRNSNEVNYAIRGQSVDALSDSRPGVLPYFNDVQFSGSVGGSAFYDLQSVQVLKGPQGTLFGRSATGGAVLFTSQKPTNDFGGYVSGALGDYSAVKTEGAVNIPIVSDKVLLRVAGFYQKHDGYQYNIFNGQHVDGFKRDDERVSLTVKPVEGVTNDLVVERSHYNGTSAQAVLYNFGTPYNPANPGAALPGAPLPIATLYGPRGNPLLGQGVALRPGEPDIVSQLQAQKARGPYVVNAGGPNYFRPRSFFLTNTTTIDLTKDLQLKNIFGYGHFSNRSGLDLVGVTAIIDNENQITKSHQFSDELQLLGKAFDGDLTYVTGVYYSDEKLNNTLLSDIAPALGLPPQENNYRKGDRTAAVYAQGTYSLTRLTGIAGLGVTVGLRYTNEKVSNAILPGDIAYTPANLTNRGLDFDQSVTSKNVGWTIGIQEQLNPNLLLYGVTRRSFKNAGFNGLNTPFIGVAGVNGGNQYLTETLTDGEIGAKFSGRIAGMLTRLNAAIFIDEIDNAQHVSYTIGAGGSPAAITVNVPHARTKGFEFDGQINPVTWLTLGGSVNYLDSTFTKNIVRGVAFGPVPDSPRWSGTGSATVTLPITENLDVFFGGNVYTQTGVYFTSTGVTNTGGRIPGYSVTNFQVGFEDHRHGLTVTANIKNAFNKVYYGGGLAPAELFNFNSVVPADPRTFLIEARLKF